MQTERHARRWSVYNGWTKCTVSVPICKQNKNIYMSDNPYAAPNFSKPIHMPAVNQDDELADRSVRLVAAILDAVALMAVLMPLFIYVVFAERESIHPSPLVEELLITLLANVVFLALNGYLLVDRGQTIGKYLMKIQIVDQKSCELLPFFRVYVCRNLWIPIIALVCVLFWDSVDVGDSVTGFLSLIDAVSIFGAGRLCLHDYIAFSKVVKFQENRPRLGLTVKSSTPDQEDDIR